MRQLLRTAPLILASALLGGCDQGSSSLDQDRIEAEDVRRELKDAVNTSSEFLAQEINAFTEESRGKIEEWRSSLKSALETKSSTEESEFQKRAWELLEKIDVSEKNLEDLKQSSRENWERLKTETQELIRQIEKDFQELVK